MSCSRYFPGFLRPVLFGTKGINAGIAYIKSAYIGCTYVGGTCIGDAYIKGTCIRGVCITSTCVSTIDVIKRLEIHSQLFQISEVRLLYTD